MPITYDESDKSLIRNVILRYLPARHLLLEARRPCSDSKHVIGVDLGNENFSAIGLVGERVSSPPNLTRTNERRTEPCD